jgi:hypothetical protein
MPLKDRKEGSARIQLTLAEDVNGFDSDKTFQDIGLPHLSF